ncbi:3 beta-hydroxysteroid dehydrogenase type 7-like [Pseudophryne corroboree]|uniref:3 beta-hydroxysteroid dehydrogenase type 7-like n=1 Tax=Pseudophryne corroboree TaxID=495146 RepID=UPI003082001A
MAKELVYLVTGGSGFIGERIVQLLLKQDYVKEVIIFDIYENESIKHWHTASATITFIKGDITNFNQILAAVKGVHVVIHTAALVDYLDICPLKKLEAINVEGTEHVLNACWAMEVRYILYTSSVSAAGPNTNSHPMARFTEETISEGELLLSYGKTKARAEQLILLANGRQTSKGDKIVTCAIRASTIYGEKVQHLLDSYQSAKSKNNQINYIEPENAEKNYTYVGNVAWMHVLAARQMQLNPERLGGQMYYAYDNTPFKKSVKLTHELFTEIDPSIQIGAHIPYWKMWLIVSFYNLMRFLVRPFWHLKPFMTLPILKLITTTFYHETDKASRHFGYRPLYTWVESKHLTCKWLKHAIHSQQKN